MPVKQPPQGLLKIDTLSPFDLACVWRNGGKLKKLVAHSRRHHKRSDTPDGVWVFWGYERAEDTSKVRDLGMGGLFIETMKVCPIDATVDLHFLVEEGMIRASGRVRHVRSGQGLGVQFKSIRTEDQERFSAMLERLVH